MNKKHLILIIILAVASVLRLFQLSSYPTGLNADEAALGYNAYSLLLTGKDEHGHLWPINLESFGDFKPAGYAYILIPFIKLFGLTELAVRLPSAIFGILAVLFIYLLTKELITDNCALIAALLLAISPWHLHFSRGGWETNISTTLLLIGTWFFVRWLKKPKFINFAFCLLPFALSMYVYQSTRIIAPLVGFGLAIIYYKNLIKYPKQIIINFLLLLLLLFPLTLSLIKSDAASRFSGVGFLADEGPFYRAQELRGQHRQWNSLFSRMFHNRPVLYSISLFKNYTDHFFGNFLFVNGDIIERNRIPETGLLYLTDFIFITLGIVYLIKSNNSKINIIWLWLFISPIAAALTFQTPHALRAHNMIIPLTIIIACGIDQISKIKYKKLTLIFIFAIYLFLFFRYLHQYYIHYPQTYPAAWEYGFKELVPYVESVKDNYEKILITDKYDQPYILFLFYSKYPPEKFQGNHVLTVRDKFNFSTVRDYDKYHFSSTPWDKVRDIHSALIVAAPEDIPNIGVNIVKTIYFPNNQPAFKIISN